MPPLRRVQGTGSTGAGTRTVAGAAPPPGCEPADGEEERHGEEGKRRETPARLPAPRSAGGQGCRPAQTRARGHGPPQSSRQQLRAGGAGERARLPREVAEPAAEARAGNQRQPGRAAPWRGATRARVAGTPEGGAGAAPGRAARVPAPYTARGGREPLPGLYGRAARYGAVRCGAVPRRAGCPSRLSATEQEAQQSRLTGRGRRGGSTPAPYRWRTGVAPPHSSGRVLG